MKQISPGKVALAASTFACAALLLTTRESAPFVLFGVGLAWWVGAKRRNVVAPIALMAGSAALWICEMKLIAASQQGGRLEHWDAFQSLGARFRALLRFNVVDDGMDMLDQSNARDRAAIGRAVQPCRRAPLPKFQGFRLHIIGNAHDSKNSSAAS